MGKRGDKISAGEAKTHSCVCAKAELAWDRHG